VDHGGTTTIEDYRGQFVVEGGAKLKLRKVDASWTGGVAAADAAQITQKSVARLAAAQRLLYADQRSSLLIVLQAMDGGGKDGTIDHVMAAFNPQGASVRAFKVPTSEERAHDFLWRVHPHAPGAGAIAIFNRSHYEDVLVTRVHRDIDAKTCERRYEEIRAFEDLLVHRGTRVIKFFLHIDKAEQLARFAARLDDPARNWKISEADYAERPYWDKYMTAYQDALRATSTRHAPWYVIPANHKWFRNLAVSRIVADTMDDLHLHYPKPAVDLADIRRKFHAAAHGG
jgi:PPK2 family polyphosphate:nucleotide phosphotransferase